MIQLSKLVEIGFSYEQATDLSAFFRNVGYLTIGTSSVIAGKTIPPNNVLVLTQESVGEYLKSDSQEYMDINNVFIQSGNLEPNRGRINNVIVYFATLSSGQTMGDLVEEFIGINANWSQLLVNTQTKADILAVAAKCLTHNRLYLAQTVDDDVINPVSGTESVADTLKALNNYNTLLCYHTTANESLAAGLAGICANPNLGATGVLYSTVTNITPENYTETVNNNLDVQNIVYYSAVNAVNGGGVSQYASPIVMGKNMISGENSKRRYIRFCVDILLKAKMIDFLKKKLTYEDVSADVGLSMAKSVLKQLQFNGLIKKDSIVTVGDVTKQTLGWEIRTIYPSILRDEDESLYNTQTYKFIGYYRDSLTGEKVVIDLAIDPTDATKGLLGF